MANRFGIFIHSPDIEEILKLNLNIYIWWNLIMKRLLICLSVLFYQIYFSQVASGGEPTTSFSIPEEIAKEI